MTAYVPGVEETDLKKVILSLQQLAAGRSNSVGSVTLTANAATTTVTDADIITSSSVPILVATTANAAAEQGAGTIYISARASGSFTITHANNAQTDRTFIYAIQG